MTLIEIMMVLAIVGLMMGIASYGIGRVRKSDLRGDVAMVATTLRAAYDRATSSGAQHRVTLDLDEETVNVERCEGKPKIYRKTKEVQEETRRALEEQRKALEQTSPEAAAALAEVLGGENPCGRAEGELGKPRALRKKRGIGFEKVFATHLDEAVTEGKVTLNFFPGGLAERAVIQVADDDENVFSVYVHPLSGRVEITQGTAEKAEEFVREDAESQVAPEDR